MPGPFRVLTVCTGNICRSPMAEAVLRERLAAAGLGEAVVVDSAGVSGEEQGNPVDPRAVRVLRDAGYTAPDRIARRVTAGDVAGSDLVLAATSRHAARLRSLDPDAEGRVRMLRAFDPRFAGRTPADEADLDLADPWYGDIGDFRRTLAEIEAASDGVIDEIRSRP